jgi:hypothetical protein
MCSSRIAVPAIWIVPLLVFGSTATQADEPIDFNRDIRPIVSGVCVACHGPDPATREAGLRLDLRDSAVQDLGGYHAIVPGDADASELIERITTDDDDMRMPPPSHGSRLSETQIDALRRWIDSGANYAEHWSYVPPVRSEIPEVQNEQWPRGPIDQFILARLETLGREPTPEADRSTLARRVALALTGLPPDQQELQSFLNDSSENAYENYVDLLLRKTAFGERWARVWLDLARYADSAGYADDPPRTIWAYRDYVIRSLNENKPFDQFTVEQIAGDLLESPTESQLVATAFHRNTMTNNEGGTNDEQFRNEAIIDRVNTTLAVWMGTTIACAQCHTHKYDPITQDEYFQVFDFFNQSQDADRRDESPVLSLWSEEQQSRREALNQQLDRLRPVLQTQTDALETAYQQWLSSLQSPPQWSRLTPTAAHASEGSLSIDDVGAIRLEDTERPSRSTYEVEIPLAQPQSVRAIQIEVPADQTTNFVISRVIATFKPDSPDVPKSRFVRVRVPGDKRWLHVAEVQIFSGGKNIATEATATQSSTAYNATADRAIDGKTEGDFYENSVTHTDAETAPWLEIDLGSMFPIDSIVIWNRTDGGEPIQNRIAGYEIECFDADRKSVRTVRPEKIPAPNATVTFDGDQQLQFATAGADYSQDGFPPQAVLPADKDNPTINPETGWAIGGGIGKPHQLTLFLSDPATLANGKVNLRIDQQSKFEQHVLTHFRLQATDDPSASMWAGMPDDIRGLVGKDSQSDAEGERLRNYFRSTTPLLDAMRQQIAAAEKELEEMNPETTVPILDELPQDRRRETHVQIRGNYQSLGNAVSAEVPEAFHPLPDDWPRNRLGLAQWLVARDNPLTARVIVNRHWEQIFGVGLVETSEDFGTQGDLPSHPELLDWLALDLMDSGWDLKALLKQMVMSATYRQQSTVTPELDQFDPANRWYARGPRFRVSAEMVRDQALAAAGLLSDRMYGPPVRPPQPQMGLTAAFGSGTDWQTSEGENRYRRGIYTTWRRSNPYPSMATFDAPNREVCTLRRSRTNTPLQALVTMNDPVFVEAAQGLARRMAIDATTEDQIATGIRLALIREPRGDEIARLRDLHDQLLTHFQADAAAAISMAENPLGKLPEGMQPASLAALTVVANVILNLDEFLMPR